MYQDGQAASAERPAGAHPEQRAAAFSADGQLLAVGWRERRVDVYEVATGRHVARLDHKQEETLRALRQVGAVAATGSAAIANATTPTAATRFGC